MSGLRNSFRFRRGVSELVGGLIVISILLVSFISITLAFQQSSISSISSYGSRARFEQERSEEVVEALLKDGECYLINVGPVDVEIVRRWWSNESSTDLDPPVVLKPKTNLSVSSLGNPDFIVTSRGNVFPARYACMKQEQQNQGGSGGALNSKSTLGDLTYLKPDNISNVGIVAEVDDARKYVAYYYNKRWYINTGTDWDPAYAVHDDPALDIDENGINELVLSNLDSEVYESEINDNTFNSNITFVDIARINENTDTVTIYYKLVMNISAKGKGNPHDIIFDVSVSLHNENGSVQTPSAVLATNTYEKGTHGNETISVYVMMGEAYFPLKAFSAFHENLKEGIYSVSILLEAEGYIGEGSARVQNLRIETIAIVGADIAWPSG